MPDISEELRTEWREGGRDKTVTVKKEGTRSDNDEESLLGRRWTSL